MLNTTNAPNLHRYKKIAGDKLAEIPRYQCELCGEIVTSQYRFDECKGELGGIVNLIKQCDQADLKERLKVAAGMKGGKTNS